MAIVTVGIDLAKNVFAIHGVDEAGKAVLVKPRVARDQLVALIAQLPPCLIGMEACSGAHHWARVFQQRGHAVKLMAPKLVAPYRMSGKRGENDAADAAAICEAVTRPSMRFVPTKDEHQQATLCLHRTRQGFIEERTATYNRLGGLLSEFGVVLPQSPEKLRREELRLLSGDCQYLFPHERKRDKPLSENGMLYALRSMGYRGRMTGHGFRALGSTILNEAGYRTVVIERALAHEIGDKVEAAYNRAEYLSERREMLQWYAEMLHKLELRASCLNYLPR